MRAQSEALRLADALEADQQGIDLGAEGMGWGPSTATRTQAAAELRRLYAEVDRLSYQLAYPDNFLKEPEQEPVAFLCSFFADPEESFLSFESIRWGTNKPLYASPLEKRKPLTDEEIICIEETIPADVNGVRPPIDFARAIEAAYGIEENKT